MSKLTITKNFDTGTYVFDYIENSHRFLYWGSHIDVYRVEYRHPIGAFQVHVTNIPHMANCRDEDRFIRACVEWMEAYLTKGELCE